MTEQRIARTLYLARKHLITAEKLMRKGYGTPHDKVKDVLGRVDEIYVWFVQTHNTTEN